MDFWIFVNPPEEAEAGPCATRFGMSGGGGKGFCSNCFCTGGGGAWFDVDGKKGMKILGVGVLNEKERDVRLEALALFLRGLGFNLNSGGRIFIRSFIVLLSLQQFWER